MTTEGPPRHLQRRRAQARAALFWETLWPRAWPVLGVLGLFGVAALSGLFLLLPPWLHLALLLGFAAALAWTLRRAALGLRAPGRDAADRRIERATGLRHRPLATLTDTPATDDPAALALWQAHRRRQMAALTGLRVGIPRPGLPARDPRALRLGLAVALVAAFVSAGGEAGERLRRAVAPALAGPVPPVPGMRLEAWVTPPAYTGAAPVFLPAGGGAATVPAGSALRIALSGGPPGGGPELVLNGAAAPLRALDAPPGADGPDLSRATSWGTETALEQGGRVVLRRDGAELAAWTLAVQADAPPSIGFSEPPGPAQRGLAIRLPWRAGDDWGLVSARAELHLARRPEAAPHAIELVLPPPTQTGGGREWRGLAQPDLSAHPWAGLEVRARLRARDGAEQEGVSEIVTFTLPERAFEHPVAREVIAVRKGLSLDPAARGPARAEIARIAAAPESFENDTTTILALRAAAARLLRDRRPEAVEEVQAILWDVAVALEEGRAERTARALAEARQALREALEQQAREREEAARNGEPRDERQEAERRAETDRRVQELRDAIQQHLQALAERLQRENAESAPIDPRRLMDPRDLDRRTERLRDAARENRPQDAERELAELEEMLRALEEGRVARAENPERRQGRERGQQQMGALGDMVRRQSEMLDRSHQRSEAEERGRPDPRRPGARPPGNRNPAQPPRTEQEREEAQRQEQGDARTQRALRRALGELMQQFGDLTGEVPEPLGRADQAMRQGAEALSQGGDARPHQERALRELTEGGRQMAQSMQRQFGRGQPGGEEGEEGEGEGTAQGSPDQGGEGQDQAQGQGEGRDPLGRRTREAAGTAREGGDTRVPDEAEALRTRRIQEELRRRVGERERPPAELDYYDRLLRRF